MATSRTPGVVGVAQSDATATAQAQQPASEELDAPTSRLSLFEIEELLRDAREASLLIDALRRADELKNMKAP